MIIAYASLAALVEYVILYNALTLSCLWWVVKPKCLKNLTNCYGQPGNTFVYHISWLLDIFWVYNDGAPNTYFWTIFSLLVIIIGSFITNKTMGHLNFEPFKDPFTVAESGKNNIFQKIRRSLKGSWIYICARIITIIGSFVRKLWLVTQILCILGRFGLFFFIVFLPSQQAK